MYAFVDRPIDDLCNSGRFMLWAMRAWTYAVERRMCPPKALASAFAHMKLLPMLPDFHMAMALLNRDGLAKLAFAPIPHIHVVEDEAILLAVWRDAMLERLDGNRPLLALLIDEDSLDRLQTTFCDAAAKLKAAGFEPLGVAHDTVREPK